MFTHFALGMRVQGSGPQEQHISPDDTSAPAEHAPPFRQSPPQDDTLCDSRFSSRRASIESLTHKLSKQHLRLEDIVERGPGRGSSSLATSACHPDYQPCTSLEVDPDLSPDSPGCCTPLSWRAEVGAAPYMDSRRLRRQLSSKFHNDPENTSKIQKMVQDMIANGEQCNVSQASPQSEVFAFTSALEPDDAAAGTEEDDYFTLPLIRPIRKKPLDGSNDGGPAGDIEQLDAQMTLRRASTPSGVKKYPTLRYRLSADVALQCPNVVRNKPRMRRRKPSMSRGGLAPLPLSTTMTPSRVAG